MALERDKLVAQHAMLNLDETQLLDVYRKMVTIRRFEEKAAEMYTRGKITGFCHLYAGEEAVAVGAIQALYDKDYVLSTYREHGHCIAKGAEPRVVMAELFGKATGISHGRGGSMHLFDPILRFMGGYAIVGGGLPLAVGLGLSVAYKEEQEIVACFFGDGALPQGAFHESLNLAALWNLPVIFICENNFYGMGTLVANAVSQEHLYKFAEPYKIPGVRVDGMDVLEVYGAVMEAAARAREGDGPSLIEAVTYRFRGHSMSDPVEYRSKREERIWLERDPIKNLRKKLLTERNVAEPRLKEIEADVEAVIDDAVRFADESPEPSIEDVSKHVYAD
ncbi:MAG TPA: pyruvate dehydrogenase (acetyl-transferring) E1 component subunit alpha [Candidatus Binataceae bacterium]|nr:pyruvate dehydrogenase (acetyl-transferring) E1 component subunit alpha [Candidatus Binataceae bacterium]